MEVCCNHKPKKIIYSGGILAYYSTKTLAFTRGLSSNDAITDSSHEILIAVAWISDYSIYKKLLQRSRDGVAITLILADHEFNKKDKIEDFIKKLLDFGVKVYYIGDSSVEGKLMHHKFCIIDQNIVITGSYNWTWKARNNHENVILIDSEPHITDKFRLEFENIKPRYQLQIENNVIIKVDISAVIAKFKKTYSSPNKLISPTLIANLSSDISSIISKFRKV